MNYDEVFKKLKEMIVNQLGIEEEKITNDATLTDDLAADSLDIVEFVMNVEEEFGIEISDEDAEKLTTVSDIVNYIINKN